MHGCQQNHQKKTTNVSFKLISEVGNELIPPTAPRNSLSSNGYEVQQLSGYFSKKKIEMISKKGVILKNRVRILCKVCVPAECSMDTQAGEKCKCPG